MMSQFSSGYKVLPLCLPVYELVTRWLGLEGTPGALKVCQNKQGTQADILDGKLI